MEINTEGSPLERIFDFETFQVSVDQLSEKQKRYAHLIDPRFFDGGVNPFRVGKSAHDYRYETPVDLEEDLFYLHPFLDPFALEQGSVRRFPAGVNEKYIAEKYFEDKWVSEGNEKLSMELEAYLKENYDVLCAKEKIFVVDIGPCGGAITTLFALRAFARAGLIDKVHLKMLDIVPNVLEATLLRRFHVPCEMIDEYGLEFAGQDGGVYKKFLGGGVMHGVKEWYQQGNPQSSLTEEALLKSDENNGLHEGFVRVDYFRGDGESLPSEIHDCDIVLSAYTHHHLNMIGRRELCHQMVAATRQGGFVGVADFYVPTYEDYIEWYKPHFEKYGDAPPVECPLVDGHTLSGWFEGVKMGNVRQSRRSFVVSGVKRD